VTKRVPRKPPADFSDLERAFFEAAPPEVPVVPAQALRFDDLEDPLDPRARPERRRRPRLERRRRPDAERPPARVVARLAETWRLSGAATARAWRLSRTVTARAWHLSRAATARWSRVAWERGRASAGPHAERARQRVVAGLSMARAWLARRARAALARIAAELPGERPSGKTLAAMVAVAVFVMIAAGVVAQRPAVSAPRAETAPSLAP
jgi:hypothetical protein